MTVADYATKEVITAQPADAIADAIRCMDGHGIHHLPVVEGDQVVGMVSDRDLLLAGGADAASARNAADGPQEVSQVMACPVYTLPEEASVKQAAIAILERRIGAVPLLAGGRNGDRPRLSGLLTETDLLRQLQRAGTRPGPAQDLLRLPVSDVMTTDVFTVAPRATLYDVLSVLRDRRVRHVPVVGTEVLVGIISDRDLRRAFARSAACDAEAEPKDEHSIGLQPATEIMTRKVLTTAPYCPINDAVEVLVETRVHALPVVADERLLGIVTQTDIVRAIITSDALP